MADDKAKPKEYQVMAWEVVYPDSNKLLVFALAEKPSVGVFDAANKDSFKVIGAFGLKDKMASEFAKKYVLPDFKLAHLQPFKPATQLSLPAGATIDATLRDTDGNPITMSTGASSYKLATTDKAGEFKYTKQAKMIPPGSAELRAWYQIAVVKVAPAGRLIVTGGTVEIQSGNGPIEMQCDISKKVKGNNPPVFKNPTALETNPFLQLGQAYRSISLVPYPYQDKPNPLGINQVILPEDFKGKLLMQYGTGGAVLGELDATKGLVNATLYTHRDGGTSLENAYVDHVRAMAQGSGLPKDAPKPGKGWQVSKHEMPMNVTSSFTPGSPPEPAVEKKPGLEINAALKLQEKIEAGAEVQTSRGRNLVAKDKYEDKPKGEELFAFNQNPGPKDSGLVKNLNDLVKSLGGRLNKKPGKNDAGAPIELFDIERLPPNIALNETETAAVRKQLEAVVNGTSAAGVRAMNQINVKNKAKSNDSNTVRAFEISRSIHKELRSLSQETKDEQLKALFKDLKFSSEDDFNQIKAEMKPIYDGAAKYDQDKLDKKKGANLFPEKIDHMRDQIEQVRALVAHVAGVITGGEDAKDTTAAPVPGKSGQRQV